MYFICILYRNKKYNLRKLIVSTINKIDCLEIWITANQHSLQYKMKCDFYKGIDLYVY